MTLRSNLLDLNIELAAAKRRRDNYFTHEIQQLGISAADQKRLQIGVLPICTSGKFWWPARREEHFAHNAIIVPTGFDHGWIVIDLLASDGKQCWVRLGSDSWLGDPEDGLLHTTVGAWLRNCGEGAVYIGQQREAA